MDDAPDSYRACRDAMRAAITQYRADLAVEAQRFSVQIGTLPHSARRGTKAHAARAAAWAAHAAREQEIEAAYTAALDRSVSIRDGVGA